MTNRKQELEQMIASKTAEIEVANKELFKILEEERRNSLEERKDPRIVSFRVSEFEWDDTGYKGILRRDTGNSYDFIDIELDKKPGQPESHLRIEFSEKDEFNIWITNRDLILTSDGMYNDHHLKLVKKEKEED